MFADVDGDGRPDLYITMNWKVQRYDDLFFRNLGNLKFVSEADKWGIADPDGGSHGAVFADLDNDGDFDLVNGTTLDLRGYGAPNDVLRNDGERFVDITPDLWRRRKEKTRGLITLDVDGDGDLDVFAVSGYRGEGDPAGEQNEFYINEGDFTFSERREGAAVDAWVGQGTTDTDFDMDGDVDIIAANRDGDVHFLRNDGRGTFTTVSSRSLGIDRRAGDGITTADVNGDGRLDVLLASDGNGHLFLAEAGGGYKRTQSFSETEGYMGGFADLDHDGDLDLIFAGDRHAYLNDGAGHFESGPAIPNGGLDDPRAIAFADVDGDGDLDFALGVKRSPNALILNTGVQAGHWLKIRLVSPDGQAGAFGAKVRVFAPGSEKLIALREAKSNYGYLAQDDPVLHVGTGTHCQVDIEVEFLSGLRRKVSGVAVDQVVTISGEEAVSPNDSEWRGAEPYSESVKNDKMIKP